MRSISNLDARSFARLFSASSGGRILTNRSVVLGAWLSEKSPIKSSDNFVRERNWLDFLC